jgi:hypothetical protein
VWLELLEGLWGVVDEGETSGLATTELGAETEDVDLVLVGLVKLSKLGTELVLGDVGTVWVEDVTMSQVRSRFSICHPKACYPSHIEDPLVIGGKR